MFRSIITTAAIAALAAGASAQSQLPAGNLHKAVAPSTGFYNMDTGFEATSVAYRSGPETIFNNRSGGAYYYTTVAATTEYADGGSFPANGVSGMEQVNGFTFTYCSGLADLSGTGVLDTEMRFYAENDSANYAGIVGWVDADNRNEACALGLAGLPGDTSGGGLECWIMTVDLSGGGECTLPQESAAGLAETAGWSMTYLDALASSGPLLDSIKGAATVGGYGAFDHFQWYDMTAPLGTENLGAYWFGGGAKVQGSFDMSLAGNVNDSTSYSSANPGANDSVNLTCTSEIRAGQAGGWAVTNPNGSSSYGIAFSTGSRDLNILNGGTASLLINHQTMPAGPFNMAGGSFGANIPNNIPSALYAQAFAHTGALNPGNISAASNGMKSVN